MFFRFHRLFLGGLVLMGLMTPLFAEAQTPQVASVQSTANSSTVQLAVPIGGVGAVSGLPEYIATLYRYALGIVTLVAIIMVIYGGFRYLLGAGLGDAKVGKKIIEDAIKGTVILFLAYVILYTVNPKTVRLSLPDIRRIQSIGINSQINQPGTSCAKDGDCAAGSFCLRTSLVGGICADGRAGNICRCRGAGCGVNTSDAGGPTNNNGRGSVDCQSGLQCQEISSDNFVCNGGAIGSACNESSEWMLPVDNSRLAGNAGLAAAAGGAVAATGVGLPFAPLVAAVIHSSSESSFDPRTRSEVRCTQPGQYCFQPSANQAGACVYGDSRDMTMFQGVPEYRTNTGLQSAVQRCDLTEAQIRELPKAYGGCRNLTNSSVDGFCVQHRYTCRGEAVCGRSAYSEMFSGTLRAYYSWENVPQTLKPETYYKQGCLKAIGATCQSDTECPSKCLQGHCSGFGALAIRSDVRPGTLRGQPTPAQVQYVYTTQGGGCPDQSWTAIDLLEEGRALSDEAQQQALDVLLRAGTIDRFACYPSRPAGAKCDLNAQCQSGRCTITGGSPRVSIPQTFNAPMDNNVGLGTCG